MAKHSVASVMESSWILTIPPTEGERKPLYLIRNHPIPRGHVLHRVGHLPTITRELMVVILTHEIAKKPPPPGDEYNLNWLSTLNSIQYPSPVCFCCVHSLLTQTADRRYADELSEWCLLGDRINKDSSTAPSAVWWFPWLGVPCFSSVRSGQRTNSAPFVLCSTSTPGLFLLARIFPKR